MALQSVTALHPDKVQQPDYIYSEQSPFERAVIRLHGLAALSTLAQCAAEGRDSTPTQRVMDNTWSLVSVIAEDIKRDLEQMRQERAK